MPIDAAHKRWWEISEVVFGIPLLVAIALQLAVHLSFPRASITLAFILAGIILILAGIAIIILARQEFAQHGQPTDPGRPTSKVVTTGIFSISRNPLYLGIVCFLVGLSLAFNLPWVLILLLPALIACHYILIAPEERYLTAKFGEEYSRYTATVHRWIGRQRTPPRRSDS